MTWNDLLTLLQDMKANAHSAMNERVQVLMDNEVYYLDVAESLSRGSIVFIPDILGDDE